LNPLGRGEGSTSGYLWEGQPSILKPTQNPGERPKRKRRENAWQVLKHGQKLYKGKNKAGSVRIVHGKKNMLGKIPLRGRGGGMHIEVIYKRTKTMNQLNKEERIANLCGAKKRNKTRLWFKLSPTWPHHQG